MGLWARLASELLWTVEAEPTLGPVALCAGAKGTWTLSTRRGPCLAALRQSMGMKYGRLVSHNPTPNPEQRLCSVPGMCSLHPRRIREWRKGWDQLPRKRKQAGEVEGPRSQGQPCSEVQPWNKASGAEAKGTLAQEVLGRAVIRWKTLGWGSIKEEEREGSEWKVGEARMPPLEASSREGKPEGTGGRTKVPFSAAVLRFPGRGASL